MITSSSTPPTRTPSARSRAVLACAAALVFGISAYAGVSHAFPAHKEWHVPGSGPSGASGRRPGAEGVYYTGGAGDTGLRCSACHIDDKQQQGKLAVDITPKPAWQTVAGKSAYKPGQTYTITVKLVGEHLGDGTDNNGMTLTIEDKLGNHAGVFEANVGGKSDSDDCNSGIAANPLTVEPTANQTTVIWGTCRAVLSIAHPAGGKARTSWNFKWTAPAAKSGDLVMYIGAVDGDQPSKSSLNDDIAEGAVLLKEGA